MSEGDMDNNIPQDGPENKPVTPPVGGDKSVPRRQPAHPPGRPGGDGPKPTQETPFSPGPIVPVSETEEKDEPDFPSEAARDAFLSSIVDPIERDDKGNPTREYLEKVAQRIKDDPEAREIVAESSPGGKALIESIPVAPTENEQDDTSEDSVEPVEPDDPDQIALVERADGALSAFMAAPTDQEARKRIEDTLNEVGDAATREKMRKHAGLWKFWQISYITLAVAILAFSGVTYVTAKTFKAGGGLRSRH